MTRALALLVLLADGPWHTLSNEDGLLFEAQDVEGSSYERLRITCTSKAAPDAVATALWGKASDSSLSPEVSKRDVVVDAPRERLYYDRVHAPVVSDRDFVMHSTMTPDDQGAWTLRFDSVTDPRFPEKEGVVRMNKIKGVVVVTPVEGGGAKIVYTNHTEAGGSIPAFITRGTSRKSAVAWVKEIRRRAEEPKAK
jgi:hypothetical protein